MEIIMNLKDTELYSRALALATEKHKGQLRTGGLEYITHPVAVADILEGWGYGTDAVIAGLFHDLLEDTDATEEEIEAIGGREVLSTVRLLTKTQGYVMEDYVSEIKKSPAARAVKAADRIHNLKSATVCSPEFKKRYIAETKEYYLDLLPERADEMLAALDLLKKSLSEN